MKTQNIKTAQAKEFVPNVHHMSGNHSSITSEEKQKMSNMMVQHHGSNWKSHHQQMHNSNIGI